MSCRQASLVTRADFTALTPKPAVEASAVPGLNYEMSTGRWQDLFMAPETVQVSSTGQVDRLFAAPSIAPGSVYGVRYKGYIEVPTEGLYTFYAPSESYMMNIVSGYELKVFVDDAEWYPATDRHALGTWSIALKPGKHRFQLSFADFRGDAPARNNTPGALPWIWPGNVPDVQVSGPGINKRTIPAEWLCR